MTSGSGNDPLVIRSLEFLGGLTARGGFRPSGVLPEVAFAGRSNVGKSSLLNKLVRRKKMARVSRTPGRTREINFFDVNGTFILADLPGYGYARVSAEARQSWQPLIDGYLRKSSSLRGVVLLLDVRRVPSGDDLLMLDTLAELDIPVMIAVTKVDKFSPTRAAQRVQEIGEVIGMSTDQIIPFSSVTGAGRDDLAAAISSLIEAPGKEG